MSQMFADELLWLQPKEFTQDYLASLCIALAQIDTDAVQEAIQMLRTVRDAGGTVFVAGNGGSAATASHWVNDLGKATKRSGRQPIRVMGLTDNVSWMTALGNDEGYERIFAGQMENFAKPGDVLIVISASGNSLNLVRAVELARERRVATIGIVGFDGGTLKELVDQPVWVRSEKGAYELVEDVHAAICHAITGYLVADRPERGP
ncbi:SIS domain-containing protein [Sinorhizobium meliloti]|uniref:SIS domain-containing protein n=2 Tax=Rhizobium meliloti TaxID=382 RepID=UPI000FD9F657|nr:SIS domain-containing protein [Sinorhizobium meliloti]MDW9441442.1 SIS domain-containing protein [Sinorhizobium meliloti]MDW9518652.1 SIS domain-containing protein [Sinorhizobium meliloti]MDW9539650.1 SIS domain-containing protein [Sinorhizobium meliloti]MDW9572689.1 SIS domain-containing protein [Sinorhizobium meliloti]MDW9758049.1 SIS domain-containing protein [Sinorhizobium meliloti]